MEKFDAEIFHRHLHTSMIGRKFIYTDITGSTMDDARRLAHKVKEYPHGTLVMSEQQTKARGAKDHKWDATNTGNIYMSVVLHMPPICKTFEGSFDLEVTACLAVLQVVKDFGVTMAIPKWPNDLWVRGHKLAGFLVEDGRLDISGSTDCLFILGMGINVNADVRRSHELHTIATSMVSERGGQYVDREKFLAAVCASLEKMLTCKREEYFRTFIKENLFQENCQISVSNLISGKVLDGKFMTICKNWDVKFLDSQTGQVFRGSSQMYSIRPKIISKIMIVFSSQQNNGMVNSLFKWLASVVDTSKYVVCLVPEATITEADEWMKNCVMLVLVEDVSNTDLFTKKLHQFLRSGGSVMASGEGAILLANILHITMRQVQLSMPDSSANSKVIPVLLQVKTVYSVKSKSGDDCELVQSMSSLNQPRMVIFPACFTCFHFFEIDASDCHLSDIEDELCLADPTLSLSVIPDKSNCRGGQVRAYFYNTGSQQDVLTVVTGCLKCGGCVALWGLELHRGADTIGVNAQDIKVVEEDRFKRDCLLQYVLETLLKP